MKQIQVWSYFFKIQVNSSAPNVPIFKEFSCSVFTAEFLKMILI